MYFWPRFHFHHREKTTQINRYETLGGPLGLLAPPSWSSAMILALLALLIPAPMSNAGLLMQDEGEEGKQMLCADGETAR